MSLDPTGPPSHPGADGTAVPDDLPEEPSISYRQGTLATRIPEAAAESESAPTYQVDREREKSGSDPGQLGEGEANQAEALGFTMLRLVGRGGMGEVWEAIQRRLWRVVAVKRLKKRSSGTSSGKSSALVRSFQGEAMTAALLDHPNIVPVYDLGFDEAGAPLLAMKYVRGSSWDRVLEDDFAHLTPDEYLARHLPILVSLVQAVAFAHSRGIVHRDLKPSQVMIGEYGEVLLMDWGLAFMVGGQPEFPQEHTPQHLYPGKDSAANPAGTPGFMAPEQTEREATRLDTWTDVYLLGGVLYMVLTGRMPHPGRSSRLVFANAAQGIVAPFGESAPGRWIPEDLAHLAMLAMTRAPELRPSAKEFLEDLQAYLTGATKRDESNKITEELAAQELPRDYAGLAESLTKLGQAQLLWPANPEYAPLREKLLHAYARLALERGDLTLARAQAESVENASARAKILAEVDAAHGRQAAQRRRLRVLTAAICVLIGVLFVAGVVFTRTLQGAHQQTRTQLSIAQESQRAELIAKHAAQQQLEKATLLLADSLVAQDRNNDAIAELELIPEEHRGWEWGFVLTRALRDLWTSPLEYLAWSPSKEYAFGYSVDAGFCALSAESGEVLTSFAMAAPVGLVVGFSRDESFAAMSATNMLCSVLDTKTWEPIFTFDELTSGSITAIEFSPDAKRIALGDSNGRVFVANLPKGDAIELARHGDAIVGLFWGKMKLISVSPQMVRRSDPSGSTSEILTESTALVGPWFPFVTRSDDARRYFAYAFKSARATVGEVDEGVMTELPVLGSDFIFSNYKPWLIIASGSIDPRLSIWDMTTRREIRRTLQQAGEVQVSGTSGIATDSVHEIDLSEDESVLMLRSSTEYMTVGFPQVKAIAGAQNQRIEGTRRVVLTPQGGAAWVVSDDGKTRLRMIGSRYAGISIPGSASSIGPADRYTSAIRFSWFEQRDTVTGDVVFVGGRMYNLYQGTRTTTDDKMIFVTGYRHNTFTIEKSERATGQILATLKWNERIQAFQLHADEALISVTLVGGEGATLYSLAGTEPVPLFEMRGEPGEVLNAGGISMDAKTCMQATSNGRLLRWDTKTGKPKEPIIAHEGSIRHLGFSPDRTIAATIGSDRHLRTWDGNTLQPIADVKLDFDVASLVFSADNSLILIWPDRGTPELREVATGKLRSKLARTDFPMSSVRFFANDTRIVASSGGAARFWNPATGEETFSMDDSFGTVNADGRKIIFKTVDFQGTLVDLAPSRIADLPGDDSMTYRQRLDLWLVRRFEDWSVSQVGADILTACSQLGVMAGPLDGEDAMLVSQTLDDFYGVPGNAQAGARRLLAEYIARLWLHQPPGFQGHSWNRWAYEDAIREFPEFAETFVGSGAILAGASAASTLEPESALKHSSINLFPAVPPMETMARVYELRGDNETALAIARRASALRMLFGAVPSSSAEIIKRLGGALPTPPPATLAFGPGSRIPLMISSAKDAGVSEEDAWTAHVEAFHEYLKQCPSPDWNQLAQAERDRVKDTPIASESWASMAEFIEELAAKLEPALFGGKSLDQARELERARFREEFTASFSAGN